MAVTDDGTSSELCSVTFLKLRQLSDVRLWAFTPEFCLLFESPLVRHLLIAC